MATATLREVPTVINGFTVIAAKIDHRGALVVLGHRRTNLGDREYVVGYNVHPDGKSWGSGTYCWNLRDALDYFDEA